MYKNSAYKDATVSTASQGQLIVLLYDAAIKNLDKAISLVDESGKIEPNNTELYGTLLKKTQAIVSELQISLDMEKGEEIAKNLMAIYVYFNREILAATMNHDTATLKNVRDLMDKLLASWKAVASSNANAPNDAPASASKINIES